MQRKHLEFNVRIPLPSRRFSLRALFVLTAVLAVGLAVYLPTANFDVTAVAQLSQRPRVSVTGSKSYEAAMTSILQELQSDRVIAAALDKANLASTPVAEIRRRLDIQVVGKSELVSVSLRGRRLRDDEEAVTKILNGILEAAVSASADRETEFVVLQKPTVTN